MITAKLAHTKKNERGGCNFDSVTLELTPEEALNELRGQIKNGGKVWGWTWDSVFVGLNDGYSCIYKGSAEEMRSLLLIEEMHPFCYPLLFA